VSVIKDLYEAELADARKVLDETAKHRARLQIELGKYRSDFDELTKNFKKKDAELVSAQHRNKDLEALHFRSEAELTTTLEDKRKLEAEVADLRAQLAKAEDGHAVAKKQLEKETLMRVDMENRCQSLQEELEFRKNVYEEECRETRKRHERSYVEVDRGNGYDYESKLAQALDELRKQHDEQVRLYKEELEQTYQAKLDNIKRSSDHTDQAAEAAREELMEARMRIESLGYQLSGLQKQYTIGMNNFLFVLMTVLYSIERLKLSPSPQSRVTVSRATSSSSSSTARQSRSKRKRVEVEESVEGSTIKSSSSWTRHASREMNTDAEEEGTGDRGSSSKFHVSQQSSATGSISIEECGNEGNFIHLKNSSDK
ncbi:hypothetical protein AB205_0041630, partial [Aquarana catesbeiana]